MKKKTTVLSLLIVLWIICLAGKAQSISFHSLIVNGAVKHPLSLTMRDLHSFQSVKVQLNDVMESGAYHGAFYYQGVPLKALLEVAKMDKDAAVFNKNVDLAVVVKNSNGKQIALSWGEIFYRNPAEITVAFSAEPIIPHRNCTKCHAPKVYLSRFNQLKRPIGFPKLVITADKWADRCLEGITEIKVVDFGAKKGDRKSFLSSSKFTVESKGHKKMIFKNLSGFHHVSIMAMELGEGRGFHGTVKFSGVPLRDVLRKGNLPMNLSTVFLLSAPDGYQSLLSYGELFLSPLGNQIIVADKKNGKPIKKGGNFEVVFPNDAMADRWLKAVQEIKIIQTNRNTP